MPVNATNSFEYQERVVAFIDVLGFSQLVKASGESQTARTRIAGLVGANRLFDSFMKKFSLATAGFFSDSFVLSMGRADQVIYMVREIGYLCRYLLIRGLPCRGAITTGLLYHHGPFIIGPAFVSATELERTIAVYPRVILDNTTMKYWNHEFRVDEFGNGSAHPHLGSLVKADRDGLNFIDIFHPEWGSNFIPWTDIVDSAESVPIDAAKFINLARIHIQRELGANVCNPKVRQKYEWLAAQINDHVRPVR